MDSSIIIVFFLNKRKFYKEIPGISQELQIL